MRYKIYVDEGHIVWSKNLNLHRLYGPALEYKNGTKSWYKNGKFHRLDGPAREFSDGHKYWWIDGRQYTEQEFNKLVKK